MTPIKVILSDFQFLTREGLLRLLEKDEDFELLDVVEHPDDIRGAIVKHHPEILIIDFDLEHPGMSELINEILKNDYPQILVITNHDNKENIRKMLDMGIKGIVTKGCSKMEILNAIQSIRIGNRFFCNRILDQVITQPEPENVTCEAADLSAREFEVLQLITKGYKTIQIADELNVSVHTINSHRKNILKKLNLKSPAELIVYAVEQGLTKVG